MERYHQTITIRPTKTERRNLDQLFERLTDAAAIASHKGSLTSALGEVVRAFGFGNFAYLNLSARETFAVSNYPPEWQQRYLSMDYAMLDPVVRLAKLHMRAFTWSNEKLNRRSSKTVQTFFHDASEFGIRSGLSIPVRTGFGQLAMLTLASGDDCTDLEHDIDPIFAAAAIAQIHSQFTRHTEMHTASSASKIVLKPQEVNCLKWSAEGKTFVDIAQIEGMKYATVRFHLQNAKQKLDVHTLTQATAVATRLRLI
jgi:LuxR family transcriptional regulator, activator of conjugal transfer of Ti plasmids